MNASSTKSPDELETLDPTLFEEAKLIASFQDACRAAANWWAARILLIMVKHPGRDWLDQVVDINSFIPALTEQIKAAADERGYIAHYANFAKKNARAYAIVTLRMEVDYGRVDPMLLKAGQASGIRLESPKPAVDLEGKYVMHITPYHIWLSEHGNNRRLLWNAYGMKTFGEKG